MTDPGAPVWPRKAWELKHVMFSAAGSSWSVGLTILHHSKTHILTQRGPTCLAEAHGREADLRALSPVLVSLLSPEKATGRAGQVRGKRLLSQIKKKSWREEKTGVGFWISGAKERRNSWSVYFITFMPITSNSKISLDTCCDSGTLLSAFWVTCRLIYKQPISSGLLLSPLWRWGAGGMQVEQLT